MENQTQSGAALPSHDLFAELDAQIDVWETKARTLDGMRDRLPKTADNVDEHKRLSIKAGMFRSVARDLSLLVRDFRPANATSEARDQ